MVAGKWHYPGVMSRRGDGGADPSRLLSGEHPPGQPRKSRICRRCVYAPNDERASACLFAAGVTSGRSRHRAFRSDARLDLLPWREFQDSRRPAAFCRRGIARPCFGAGGVLDRTGIVGGLRPSNEDEDLHYFGLEQICVVLAEQSGYLISI